MTTGKTIALTRRTFVGKVMSLLFNKLSRLVIRRRRWHPTPVLLPGKSHGRKSLVGCSPRGREESDMPERLHFHFYALEKEMATHSSVLAWRIPGMGSHRVGHNWSDLAARSLTVTESGQTPSAIRPIKGSFNILWGQRTFHFEFKSRLSKVVSVMVPVSFWRFLRQGGENHLAWLWNQLTKDYAHTFWVISLTSG